MSYARKHRIMSLWKFQRDVGWVQRRGWVPAYIIFEMQWKVWA